MEPRLTLLHSPSFPIERYRKVLDHESITAARIASLTEVSPSSDSLKVVLLDHELANDGQLLPETRSCTVVIGVGDTGGESNERIDLDLPPEPTMATFARSLRRAYELAFQRRRAERLERELREREDELTRLNEIGIALSTVRDHSVLLDKILTSGRELSRADAGSLYLLDEIPGEGKVLRWKLAQNDSIAVDFEEKILPITKRSLAGYVALTGETLAIDDAYELPADVEYAINRSFDQETGYRTRSMLVVPMTNHLGELIGVLQLINRRRPTAPRQLRGEDFESQVIGFDEHTTHLMRSLAGQAAVAVENNILHESIERLFEGFVTAAVTAIEQRDPTTSGHSFRVADLTVELAKVLENIESGEYASVCFNEEQIKEIRYASLLHDFGKVAVRETVLVKEKKLYPMHLETIRLRFEYAMKALEADYLRQKLDHLLLHGPGDFPNLRTRLDQEGREAMSQLQRDLDLIIQANEPTILPEGDFEYLQQLGRREYQDAQRRRQKLLSGEEARILSIRKGNLDENERLEIESHVTHTFEFLSKIPWTKDLWRVPEIAYAHHEKLNGRGYPRRLRAEDIPLQSRMMTVSDIYDALTASDRPYKRAISTERAIDILQMEVDDGLLDGSLVRIFTEAKIFERVRRLRT